MNGDDRAPTEAELREAELLAAALAEPAPGRDLSSVDDALAAAMLIQASRGAELSALRERAIRDRIWPERARPAWRRTAVAAVAAVAAAVAWLMLQPVRPANLPPPGVDLLRAQLAAARPGVPAAQERLDAEMAGYRRQVYAALEEAYGARR